MIHFPKLQVTTTRTITYTIPGQPIPWKRPGGVKHRFDEQKYDKMIVGLQLRHQHTSQPKFIGSLLFDIEFHFSIPQKVKNKEAWLGRYVTRTPDCSNLLKFYEDAAQGILFEDDKQIVQGTFRKIYGIDPKTVIRITELKESV